MKHLVAILIGTLAVLLGAAVLALGAKTAHTASTIAGGAVLGLGVLLLIPAQAKEAGDTLVGFVRRARSIEPPPAGGAP